MDIIAQLKAERDKAAQQVNALDTAIKGTERIKQHGGNTRTSDDECRCTGENFGISKSTVGTLTGPERCLHRSQAAHLARRSSTDQSGDEGEMGESESGKEVNYCSSHKWRSVSRPCYATIVPMRPGRGMPLKAPR